MMLGADGSGSPEGFTGADRTPAVRRLPAVGWSQPWAIGSWKKTKNKTRSFWPYNYIDSIQFNSALFRWRHIITDVISGHFNLEQV